MNNLIFINTIFVKKNVVRTIYNSYDQANSISYYRKL